MEQDKCIKITKYHLRNYGYYQQAIKNITDRIQDINMELSNVSARISTYGLNTGGGNLEFNEIERAANKRLELEEQKNILNIDLLALKKRLQTLDQCINLLPPDEKEALVMFYIKRYKYYYICDALHFSERCIRNKIRAALKGVAVMLFGCKACDTF